MTHQGPPNNGRRPLLSTFVGNNRQMLQNLRDSLSHVVQLQDGSTAKVDGTSVSSKQDISQSTPNLNDRMVVAGGASSKMTRHGYHQKALAEIRNSLRPYENIDLQTENNLELPEGHRNLLHQLQIMGYDEEMAFQALKKSGSKSLEAAVEALQNYRILHQQDGKNGFNKSAGLVAFPAKVIRKPSFEEKYRQGSQTSTPDNISVRSDSPSVNSRNAAEHFRVNNQHQTNLMVPAGGANLTVPVGGHCLVNGTERTTPPPPPPPRAGPGTLPQGSTGQSQQQYQQYHQNQQQQQQLAESQNATHAPPGHVQQMIRRMSAGAPLNLDMRPGALAVGQLANGPVLAHSGISPVTAGRQPVIMQNSIAQQNGSSGLQHLQSRLLNGPHHTSAVGNGQASPVISAKTTPTLPYSQALPNKPNPNLQYQCSNNNNGQEQSHRLCTPAGSQSSSGSSTPTSNGPSHCGSTPSPTIPTPRPAPMQAWGAKQSAIVMQSVKSCKVQKPVLQTATAPLTPLQHGHHVGNSPNYISSVQAQVNMPSSASHHHQQYHHAHHQEQQPHHNQQPPPHMNMSHTSPLRNVQIEITRQGNNNMHSNAHHFANQGQFGQQLHANTAAPAQQYNTQNNGHLIQIQIKNGGHRQQAVNQIQIQNLGHGINGVGGGDFLCQRKPSPAETPGSTPRSDSPVSRATNHSPMSIISSTSTPSTNSDIPDRPPPPYPGRLLHQPPLIVVNKQNLVNNLAIQNLHSSNSDTSATTTTISSSKGKTDSGGDTCHDQEETQEKTRCTSPIPERKPEAKKKDEERKETKVRMYSPQAYKFFMEQHVENILKSHQQRVNRRIQLESEMSQVGLSDEAQCQMRKMLHQKESNYIRLKRAKMDKHQFEKITTLGIGAFGEVALVRKRDTRHLYAMKTLRKNDVLRKNQVAHVKAERDILAEADNEWVVKLYYSFQDRDNLYFVMDYIPGGDMMGLLIKFGIFEERLARFYIAELVLAIESVHKMGFIHRDIKPDNILIDRDGHIKLTDFGLCTGFRWTHNSKYYQKGNHMYQDSMEPDESWEEEVRNKPLERRKNQERQRSLAHSLVGTPNYIAPEVLQRRGYKACCDWWSVGVILYEMLVGQPPFLADSPAETQYKVINWQHTLHIPEEAELSRPASDLILRLCCGHEERLGCNGASEIKDHPFFEPINLDGLRQQASPYLPKISYPTDTSNFDPVEPGKLRNSGSTDEIDKRDPILENGKHPEHAFFEFTFRRFFDDGGHPYPTRKPKPPETNGAVYV